MESTLIGRKVRFFCVERIARGYRDLAYAEGEVTTVHTDKDQELVLTIQLANGAITQVYARSADSVLTVTSALNF